MDKESLAATKIQAGFRGYRTRKEYGNLVHSFPSHNSSSIDEVRSNRNTHNLQQSLTNSNNLDNAATRIQASYRGYLTRKALRDDNMPKHTSLMTTSLGNSPLHCDQRRGSDGLFEQHNCHLTDTDIDHKVKAVTKIQAGYRGYKTRKSLAPLLHHENRQNPILNKENENFSSTYHTRYRSKSQDRNTKAKFTFSHNSLYDPELAATKIQAIYRGYRTRQHLPK
ncbi:unnamed protein product [Heterobilharzia americana]|nr:unnamed protein product [Heterobilharzia americana]